jgi:hypothetical protein
MTYRTDLNELWPFVEKDAHTTHTYPHRPGLDHRLAFMEFIIGCLDEPSV